MKILGYFFICLNWSLKMFRKIHEVSAFDFYQKEENTAIFCKGACEPNTNTVNTIIAEHSEVNYNNGSWIFKGTFWISRWWWLLIHERMVGPEIWHIDGAPKLWNNWFGVGENVWGWTCRQVHWNFFACVDGVMSNSVKHAQMASVDDWQ